MPKDQAAAGIQRETLKHLKRQSEMRKDVSRLRSACCAPQTYELLQEAPKPELLTNA
jgi:hypothetical protein